MLRGVAPLFPLGFAILGLGCTVPLTIGGGESDLPGDVGLADDAGTGSDAGDDDGGPVAIDAGPVMDAGDDAGAVVPDGGMCLPYGDPNSSSFANCCSRDVSQGVCVARPSGWTCSAQRICTWSGGTCESTGHDCTEYSDCCSGGCFSGKCRNADATALQTSTTLCSKYSDCSSDSCYLGRCTTAPAATCTTGQYNQKCTTWQDCCSLECDDGGCFDTTLPMWMQQAPAMDQIPYFDSLPTQELLAPRFEVDETQSLERPAQ